MKDYYYLLGIDENASSADIKEAHRKLSKKFHPDLNPNDAHSEKMFKDIQEAYEWLIDSGKRKQYDAAYAKWSSVNDSYSASSKNVSEPVKSLVTKNTDTTLIAVGAFLIGGFLLMQLFMNGEEKHWILFGLGGAIALSAFMAPFLISVYNRHPLKWAVFAAVLILGWTGLGWIGCLIFSLYNEDKS